jgi:hypothetical protein
MRIPWGLRNVSSVPAPGNAQSVLILTDSEEQGLSRGVKSLAASHKFPSPCEGGVEYLHRSPASRKRHRIGNPVPGGITGPPCSWGI